MEQKLTSFFDRKFNIVAKPVPDFPKVILCDIKHSLTYSGKMWHKLDNSAKRLGELRPPELLKLLSWQSIRTIREVLGSNTSLDNFTHSLKIFNSYDFIINRCDCIKILECITKLKLAPLHLTTLLTNGWLCKETLYSIWTLLGAIIVMIYQISHWCAR